MATMTKTPSRPNWWLWGGIAAAVIAAGVVIYVLDPFGLATFPAEPALTEPVAEEAAPAATE
jgi:hypothetical protein